MYIDRWFMHFFERYGCILLTFNLVQLKSYYVLGLTLNYLKYFA